MSGLLWRVSVWPLDEAVTLTCLRLDAACRPVRSIDETVAGSGVGRRSVAAGRSRLSCPHAAEAPLANASRHYQSRACPLLPCGAGSSPAGEKHSAFLRAGSSAGSAGSASARFSLSYVQPPSARS